jgi:hypothetical protein
MTLEELEAVAPAVALVSADPAVTPAAAPATPFIS